MFDFWMGAREAEFLLDLALSLVCGLLIGGERELKGKPAGISTQTLVISGAMLFAFMSRTIGGPDPTRIAGQIVSGIGFLGAGIIMKAGERGKVNNVTTAASIWYSAAVGMALGFNYHIIALASALYAIMISRLPRLRREESE